MSATKSMPHRTMLIAIMMTLMLSSCSGTASSGTILTSAQTRARRLALGTIGLEGTLQAVDAASATDLLPLWELYSDLSVSGTAAWRHN